MSEAENDFGNAGDMTPAAKILRNTTTGSTNINRNWNANEKRWKNSSEP